MPLRQVIDLLSSDDEDEANSAGRTPALRSSGPARSSSTERAKLDPLAAELAIQRRTVSKAEQLLQTRRATVDLSRSKLSANRRRLALASLELEAQQAQWQSPADDEALGEAELEVEQFEIEIERGEKRLSSEENLVRIAEQKLALERGELAMLRAKKGAVFKEEVKTEPKTEVTAEPLSSRAITATTLDPAVKTESSDPASMVPPPAAPRREEPSAENENDPATDDEEKESFDFDPSIIPFRRPTHVSCDNTEGSLIFKIKFGANTMPTTAPTVETPDTTVPNRATQTTAQTREHLSAFQAQISERQQQDVERMMTECLDKKQDTDDVPRSQSTTRSRVPMSERGRRANERESGTRFEETAESPARTWFTGAAARLSRTDAAGRIMNDDSNNRNFEIASSVIQRSKPLVYPELAEEEEDDGRKRPSPPAKMRRRQVGGNDELYEYEVFEEDDGGEDEDSVSPAPPAPLENRRPASPQPMAMLTPPETQSSPSRTRSHSHAHQSRDIKNETDSDSDATDLYALPSRNASRINSPVPLPPRRRRAFSPPPPSSPVPEADSDIEFNGYAPPKPFKPDMRWNAAIEASEEWDRKPYAHELIKNWKPYAIDPPVIAPVYFSRQFFLSRVLGGNAQRVHGKPSAQKLKVQEAIFGRVLCTRYHCEMADWNPHMPKFAGAHGCVYFIAPAPFPYTDPYPVFCQRAGNAWEYCGEYAMTVRTLLPDEHTTLAETTKRNYAKLWSHPDKGGPADLVRMGFEVPTDEDGDFVLTPGMVYDWISAGLIKMDAVTYECVGFNWEFYKALVKEVPNWPIPTKKGKKGTRVKVELESEEEEEEVVAVAPKKRRRRRVDTESEDDDDAEAPVMVKRKRVDKAKPAIKRLKKKRMMRRQQLKDAFAQ